MADLLREAAKNFCSGSLHTISNHRPSESSFSLNLYVQSLRPAHTSKIDRRTPVVQLLQVKLTVHTHTFSLQLERAKWAEKFFRLMHGILGLAVEVVAQLLRSPRR
eukprot:SAG25_NODE_511_length_7294_cov_181.757192_5_plen_106_part_00